MGIALSQCCGLSRRALKQNVQTMEQFKQSRNENQLGRVVHVKGFGGGLGDHYWSDALGELDGFDTIAWDGDGYGASSFTELVVRFLRQDGGRRAVAFKLGTPEQALQKVSEKWAHVDVWSRITVVAVDKEAESKQLAAEVDKLPEGLPGWAKDFFVLGRAAILATGSKKVVCLGGGGITGREAEASMSMQQGVSWTVFAASRGKQEEHPSVVDWAVENEQTFKDHVKLVKGKDPNEEQSMAGHFT